MNAGEVTWQEEHAELDAQEDEKVELRTFKVFYAVTTPGIATVLARDATEAVQKLYECEAEQYDNDPLASRMDVEEVREVDRDE